MHLRTSIYSTVAVMQRDASVQMAGNITRLLGIVNIVWLTQAFSQDDLKSGRPKCAIGSAQVNNLL